MIETAGDHRCQLIYSTLLSTRLCYAPAVAEFYNNKKISTLDLVLHPRMNALQTLIRP
jgi:hypothetical protein